MANPKGSSPEASSLFDELKLLTSHDDAGTPLQIERGAVAALAFSKDGGLLIAASTNAVYTWRLGTRQQASLLERFAICACGTSRPDNPWGFR
jgi:hypothetical protein